MYLESNENQVILVMPSFRFVFRGPCSLSIMTDPSFHAHELVYCAQCYLPYDLQVNITKQIVPQDAVNRSWYLTNCGHALCSNCLFPNGGNSIDPESTSDLTVVPGSLENTVHCPKCDQDASIVILGAEVCLFRFSLTISYHQIFYPIFVL